MLAVAMSVLVALIHSMSILVLSLSQIPSDPRVHKTCQALCAAGFKVTAVGFECPKPSAHYDYDLRTLPATPHNLSYRLAIAARQLPAHIFHAIAHKTYWLDRQVKAMWALIQQEKPQLIYANDLNTLPIAVRLKQLTGAKLIYDTHEFAVGEGADRLMWKLLFPVYRRALEAKNIAHVDQVMSVSDGIGHALKHLYALQKPVMTLRNVPPFQMTPPRDVGETIRVLYHGLYLKDRGLEALIESVPLWHERFILHLRGYGAPAYEAHLRDYARKIVPNRIVFEPAVATHDLVEAATSADIGILPFPTKGIQKEFSLPNKLFEYMMAGLCVITTPCQDISAHLTRYSAGLTTSGASPQALADTLNNLTPSQINQMKRASLIAAKELNWEVEQLKLFHVMRELNVVVEAV